MAPLNRVPFLDQLYYHVALPRNVPGHEDGNRGRIEEALLTRLIKASSSLYKHAMPGHQIHIRTLQDALVTCKALNVDGMISRSTLLGEFRSLSPHKMLILYACAQNCALLIYENPNDLGERRVVFESFETSATCDTVLATKNALLWDFPGCAVSVPYDTFSDDSFQQSLSAFMEQASTEFIAKFASTTYKAAAPLPEIRDTSDPALVSQLLMAMLEANGRTISVPLLRKRVRDTVSFDKAYKPWRRSPFYLVLRVAMQRYLYRVFGADIGRLYYKLVMCLFISQLLEEVLKRIPFEAAFYLRQKLGRRLAKLDSDTKHAIGTAKSTHVYLLHSLESRFYATLSTTGGYLKSVWRNQKLAGERKVPLLRQHAFESELALRLTNSGGDLRGLLSHHGKASHEEQYSPSKLLEQYERSSTSIKSYMDTARRHISMSQYHESVVIPSKTATGLGSPGYILEMSKTIRDYVHKIKHSVEGYPDQKSRIFLHLFEMWKLLDQATVKQYPLLEDYHPGFENDVLDPIQLLTLEDLHRAHDVQAYLTKRYRSNGGKRRTIFDDPTDECFAARYYDSQELMMDLRQKIEHRAALAVAAKKIEWETTMQQYRELIDQRNATDCNYDAVILWDGTTDLRHRWPCQRHALQDQANNLRIQIIEWPLPAWEPASKATMFELRCPQDFAAYRDTTWLILSTLCHPPAHGLDRIPLIREYSQLRPYAMTECHVTLGSENKAHLKTHYSGWEFPIDLVYVSRVCGLKPRYYDTSSQTWTSSRTKASIWHHFPVMLPRDSPLQVLRLSYCSWPSSNDVQASQGDCPTDLNMYEFMALQGLLVGTHSRWLDLLREMGSTNLNFSAESTWTLVQRLILQIGPATTGYEPHRDAHSALLDSTFCSKLLQQIQQRLTAIQENWREPVQMDTLITILLRVASLSPATVVRHEAMVLLRRARRVTDRWRALLQSQVTEDSKVTQFVLWASLLCKRTLHLDRDLLLDTQSLRHFIDASISLQYNLLTETYDSLPFSLRNAIINDVLFAYENRDFVKDAILADSTAFIGALGNLWQIPEDQNVADLVPQPVPDTTWLLLTLRADSFEYSHSVHYNYVHGTLLIDGKEMGSLPLAYRSHPGYLQTFGTKNPVVFPSPLPGMSFTMSDTMKNGHRIHLGFRHNASGGKNIVIQAVQKGQILELIPPSIFRTAESSDLPGFLIEDCFHWLNVRSGELEIRRQDTWASKPGNWWILGIRTGLYHGVRCYGEAKESRLLDPASVMAQDIARLFESFEHPAHILVFVSRGKVTTELKRLELSFFINPAGLLQSNQLGAVIPENQDAGTWYGLKSKIVIQSTANLRQKSILVPLGDIQASKEGSHVSIEVETGSGIYLKFGINEVIGRVDCPPEPRLLYTKALFHAYTSHVMYDPLTRRTGAEEAIHLLRTGSYLPWRPLIEGIVKLLKYISDLTPMRKYYPEDLKNMETVTWRSDIPIPMQDDRYRALVETILRRSSDLSNFFLEDSPQSLVELSPGNPHLESRAMSRSHTHKVKEDTLYHARDTRKATLERRNVLEISKLLLTWQPAFAAGPTLISLLHDAPVVGGYDKFFQKWLLTDHLAVDVRAEWGALAQKISQSNIQDRYRLLFIFSPMVFSGDADMDLMRILVSFLMIPEIDALEAPQHPAYYHFRADGAPQEGYLISLFEKARMSFSDTGFKKRHALIVAESQFQRQVDHSCELLARSIREQWPHPEIDREKLIAIDPTRLDIERALADVSTEWARLTRNHELALYLEKVQQVLDRVAATGTLVSDAGCRVSCKDDTTSINAIRYPMRVREDDDSTLSTLLRNTIHRRIPLTPTLMSHVPTKSTGSALLARPGNVPRHSLNEYDVLSGEMRTKMPSLGPDVPKSHRKYQAPEMRLLQNIVASFEGTSSFVQSRYAKELRSSINALHGHIGRTSADVMHRFKPRVTREEIFQAKDKATLAANQVRESLSNHDPQAKWLQLVDLWPRMTTTELLSEMRSTSSTIFGAGAKEALVTLGLAVSKWQHLFRIQDAQKRHKEQQEREEWANQGHTNWDPLAHPDWLLLEIDGDFLLRENQVQVAMATISPQSGENSVLQLLMGQGKTSCILPMVAAVLANKLDLARIVVPRPLLLQSAQVLQAKLGGLVNREIIHIPFSRKTPTNQALMRLHRRLHFHARDNSGVILALPEHILSFKLSGMQQLCDNHLDEASTMIRTQNWLDKHARDVLDECDVSFAIRTQLIYPSGSQMTVDGHPLRWQVTEMVLHHVKDFLPTVQSRFRHSIEIVERSAEGFPLVYFLRKDAEDYLIELLVRLICSGLARSILPCAELPGVIQQDVQVYISRPTVHAEVTRRIIDYFWDKQNLMKTVTLLRGLFVHRILLSSLKKRWNVQYGLHPARAPLAVPYLAKGVPSPTAEWGHPDVAIVLTCLSFYYQGLTINQFKQAFEQLLRSDEPSVEYEKWILNASIPNGLDDFAAINVDDNWQLTEVHRFIGCNPALIDFFLNKFVFPKYAKTFSLKLQASGWNLFPSISVHAKGCRVTGFSGTNDSRHHLPMLIKQADLPHLAHTNAEVLFYLLAPRNQGYIRMNNAYGARWTEIDLLDHLTNPFRHPQHGIRHQERIRVLIDAGAQIELSNRDFAAVWLEKDTDAAAVVYFHDDHRAWVLYRNSKRTPLLASPFADSLDRCLVYLDESHCRGTDVKLPPDAKAALTLGPNLTKDTLVQAAMRLRLLGQTQSVRFYSPPEVHQSILDRLQKDEFFQPDSSAVLQWVIGQTCDNIEQQDPSYFAQTSHYLKQEQARLDFPNYLQDQRSQASFLATVRVKESMSLKQLYEPKPQRASVKSVNWNQRLQPFHDALQLRKRHFQDRGSAVHASVGEEVEIEQEREAEREVENEVEDVRETQRPPRFSACKIPSLHEDVKHFATEGWLVAGSDAYKPMFSVLQRTALGSKHALSVSMKSNLWVSKQFTECIATYEANDNYIRSCHWVVWSSISKKALLVSPEEANQLIPILRPSASYDSDVDSGIHLIVYSAPITRRMLHFNHLDYYAVPPLPSDFKAPIWLRIELGIFSGRLHLEFDEYPELLGYLGLAEDLSLDSQKQAFAPKPLTFLHEWIALRRKGQDFEHTPMGFVTTGKPLTANHPFFRALPQDHCDPDIRPQVARITSGRAGDAEVEEEDDGEHDDEDFVPAVEHIDDSDVEDERQNSDDEGEYVDAAEAPGGDEK